MNNTDEYWEVDGVSLHQYGWSVTTLSGTRYAVPPLRGDNARAAYVPGELWLPKLPDARTISLPMFLIGADPATGVVVDDSTLRFNDSWNYLRQLFWQPERQLLLGRRWLRTDPGTGNPVIAYAEARAQLANDLQLSMTGRTRATFTADLRLADPFFYGPITTTTALRAGQGTTLSNPGDWSLYHKHLQVKMVGPLTAPRLTNDFTSGPDVYFGIKGSIAAGETITYDIPTFVANSSTGRTRTGEVYNAGTRSWMALLRGDNKLKFTATAGSGTCQLAYRPPYL